MSHPIEIGVSRSPAGNHEEPAAAHRIRTHLRRKRRFGTVQSPVVEAVGVPLTPLRMHPGEAVATGCAAFPWGLTLNEIGGVDQGFSALLHSIWYTKPWIRYDFGNFCQALPRRPWLESALLFSGIGGRCQGCQVVSVIHERSKRRSKRRGQLLSQNLYRDTPRAWSPWLEEGISYSRLVKRAIPTLAATLAETGSEEFLRICPKPARCAAG